MRLGAHFIELTVYNSDSHIANKDGSRIQFSLFTWLAAAAAAAAGSDCIQEGDNNNNNIVKQLINKTQSINSFGIVVTRGRDT